MNELQILIGCEESQEVAKAFRAKGHNAFSCDVKPSSGGHPEWHLQMDVFEAIKMKKWDMGIFFPDCTYLTISANKWYAEQPPRKSGTLVGYERYMARVKAIKFFLDLYHCGIEKIAMENPIGIMSSVFRKPDQIVQPWMFGHGETKATCLWLRNLPKLTWSHHANLFGEPKTTSEGRVQRLHSLPPTADRAELRSKTFPGIAKAMANSWS